MDERHLKYGIKMDAVVGQDILKPNKNVLVKCYIDINTRGGRLSMSNESHQFVTIYFDDSRQIWPRGSRLADICRMLVYYIHNVFE